ncbi:MAG: hypothetical protein AB7O59_20675 [Pirellulales bacterium]
MHLTRLERRILALLEEAGEENVVSLTNSVANPQGACHEIDNFVGALITLLNAGLIELASKRDESTLRWVGLPKVESQSRLNELQNSLQWNTEKGIWNWAGAGERPEAILTSSGRKTARQVLSEDGWPTEPLGDYF